MSRSVAPIFTMPAIDGCLARDWVERPEAGVRDPDDRSVVGHVDEHLHRVRLLARIRDEPHVHDRGSRDLPVRLRVYAGHRFPELSR